MSSSPHPAPTSAIEIAAGVRSGVLSAPELAAGAVERIAAADGQIGAFQLVRPMKAVSEAEEVGRRPDLADLPLAGVPMAIKDNVPVAGEPMRNGSPLTPDEPQRTDHPVVARVRAAGAVVIGLTRVPELCVFGATDSQFGITHNPWDLSRTSGGSSGGSAAAVAAGLVPVAHGNDGMGSIRVPAACCGVLGIKPGGGVVPVELAGEAWFGMAENGALATSVGDAALLLSVMADDPSLATVSEPDRTLRIGVSAKPPVSGVHLDGEHRDALFRTAQALQAAGHRVKYVDPPYPKNPLPVIARWVAGASLEAESLDRSGLDRAVRSHAALGDRVRRRNLIKETDRDAFRSKLDDYFASLDLLVTPTLARPPLRAARWGQRSWPHVFMANAMYAPYCAPWNFAGYPAVSVPAGLHPHARTPLSVQLVAPDGGEPLLLAVAAQLERVAPWPRVARGFG